jgi:PilZ domain
MKPAGGPPAFYKQRSDQRRPVDGAAQLSHSGWYQVEVTIRDVSTSGFMAECAEPVRIGSHVSLEVPGIGAVRAQVRWQLAGRMGGMFLDPISLSRCEWTATPVAPEQQVRTA